MSVCQRMISDSCCYFDVVILMLVLPASRVSLLFYFSRTDSATVFLFDKCYLFSDKVFVVYKKIGSNLYLKTKQKKFTFSTLVSKNLLDVAVK